MLDVTTQSARFDRRRSVGVHHHSTVGVRVTERGKVFDGALASKEQVASKVQASTRVFLA